jgi:hypothetical protein
MINKLRIQQIVGEIVREMRESHARISDLKSELYVLAVEADSFWELHGTVRSASARLCDFNESMAHCTPIFLDAMKNNGGNHDK